MFDFVVSLCFHDRQKSRGRVKVDNWEVGGEDFGEHGAHAGKPQHADDGTHQAKVRA